MKYRIVGTEVMANEEVDIPEGMIPLNTFYNPVSGRLTLALLMPVVEEHLPEKESTLQEVQPEEP